MIQIINRPISRQDLKEIAQKMYGHLVKAVVDLRLKKIALGGELHADGEALLLQEGSKQKDLWGMNLYPDQTGDGFIEFDSMINIRPSQGNLSRQVQTETLQKQIRELVSSLIIS